MSFWGELKRRNVFKVGVAYAIVAWLIIEAVATIFPVLQLPEWSVTFVTVLVIIGFPFALLFAWAFEITPDGIKLTKEVPRAESITRLTGQKLNYIVTALLVLAVAFLLFDNYYLDRRAIEPKQETVVADVEEAPKTIAVLPFVDLSPEKDQEYFVDGLSEELLNSFTKIPDLSVIARTSSFTFKDSDKTVQEIASVLGADHILEGSVRKAGNALRITAQLIQAVDGIHLWSETYDRELKDIFAVQEDIATAVAKELKVTLGIDHSFRQLGGTDNLEAYELFLVVQGLMGSPEYLELDNIKYALESISATLALDPEFSNAWAIKSRIHEVLATFGPANRFDTERNAALSAAQRAIELEPNLAEGYIALGMCKAVRGNLIDAELSFRKALELQNEKLWNYASSIHFIYSSIGYFKKTREILEEARRNDPLNAAVRAGYVVTLGLLGDMQGVENENERCKALFGDMWKARSFGITYHRLGTGDPVSSDDIEYSAPIFNAAKEHLDSPKEGLSKLHQLYSDENNLSGRDISDISILAAYFGDPEFAMDTMEKTTKMHAGHLFKIWFPVMKEVRKLPRFKELLKEIGLIDYWNEFGWPDLCRPIGDDDFECD